MHVRMSSFLVPILAGAFTIGCNGSTVLNAEDYDQSCSADDDCVVVEVGDICCGCDKAAINKNDLDDYEDDRGTCEMVCDIGCPNVEAFCNAGKCDVR